MYTHAGTVTHTFTQTVPLLHVQSLTAVDPACELESAGQLAQAQSELERYFAAVQATQ